MEESTRPICHCTDATCPVHPGDRCVELSTETVGHVGFCAPCVARSFNPEEPDTHDETL